MNVFIVFLLMVLTVMFTWFFCDQYRESALIRLGMVYQKALDDLTARNEALKADNERLKRVVGEMPFTHVHLDNGTLESMR